MPPFQSKSCYKPSWPQSKTRPQKEGERKRIGSSSGRRVGGSLDDNVPAAELPLPHPLTASLDFLRWAICLARWIIASKSKFGWFLCKSFRVLRRDDAPTATTAFPLPVPKSGILTGSGPGLSKKRLLSSSAFAKTGFYMLW